MMKLFMFIALVACAICSIKSEPVFQLKSKGACCQLEWVKWIYLQGGGRAIPSSGISFGQTPDGINYYFAAPTIKGKDIFDEDVVLRVTSELRNFYWYSTNSGDRKSQWDEFYVLSNPNNCEIGWTQATPQRLFLYDEDTMEWSFPRNNGTHHYYFARKLDQGVITHSGFMYRANDDNKNPSTKFYGLSVGTVGFTYEFDDPTNAELLYVDCSKTLKKQLNAELYDIQFESSDFISTSDDKQQVLATTEVINNSDDDQIVNVDLKADISSSLEMKHETKLNEVTDVKWGVHGSANLGWLGKIFGMKLNVDGGYDSHTTKNKFASEGIVSFEAKETAYQFKEQVLIKGRTKTKVAIKTKQIDGSQKYTAYYRISRDALKAAKLDASSVEAIFKRLGHPNMQLKVVDASLVFETQGYMSVSTGFDTHVLIESFSLNSNETLVSQSRPVTSST